MIWRLYFLLNKKMRLKKRLMKRRITIFSFQKKKRISLDIKALMMLLRKYVH